MSTLHDGDMSQFTISELEGVVNEMKNAEKREKVEPLWEGITRDLLSDSAVLELLSAYDKPWQKKIIHEALVSNFTVAFDEYVVKAIERETVERQQKYERRKAKKEEWARKNVVLKSGLTEEEQDQLRNGEYEDWADSGETE